jgi:radical SAM superfamily enzyme YgiQ (UPF0313 family)
MKVLLISANVDRMNILPLPLGLAMVAAASRRAGHDVILLNLMFEGDAESAIRDHIQEFRPGVIGLSVRNIDDQNMEAPKFLLSPIRRALATCRRVCDAPTVVGGAGYSIFPESALRYLGANVGIRGEEETIFPVVLERIARRASLTGLPGVYLPGRPPTDRSFCSNLDDLPLPEPASWIPSVPDRAEFWVPVQSRRGCPMDCSFCSTSAIEGRSIRRHSPEMIADWLEQLAASGFHNFHFVDNTFNLPLAYAKELCRKIFERDLELNVWCIVYPKWIDSELAQLMAQAGCREVSLGFESGSNRILESINKRFKIGEVRTVSKMFADAGIQRRGFLLLGGPGETRGSVEESLEFADSLHLDALKITVGLRIYPETPLATTALAEGLIAADDDLLWPRFYLAPELKDWLPERVAAYKTSRSWVM